MFNQYFFKAEQSYQNNENEIFKIKNKLNMISTSSNHGILIDSSSRFSALDIQDAPGTNLDIFNTESKQIIATT